MVFSSVKYPLPKSPYFTFNFAISPSRSTLAMMDAAETIGYVLSALCSETIFVLVSEAFAYVISKAVFQHVGGVNVGFVGS